MKKMNKTRRGGFTLVEMLVVIAIIGIIAAILVPTLFIAIRKAKESKIGQEVNQLAMHIEVYKQENGDSPPDCYKLRDLPGQATPDPMVPKNKQLFLRHLRKAFPRHTEKIDPVTGLPVNTAMTLPNGLDAKFPPNHPIYPNQWYDIAKLDASEALVFWLGMIKNDPRFPLNGTSRPVRAYPFDETRLIDLDGDGWLSYIPPDGKDAPYVYFDSRTYANAILYYVDWSVPNPPGAIWLLQPYATSLNETDAVAAWKFANETEFQIISAGLDGEYGEVTLGTYKRFPFGNNFELADLDNISNFSDGKIFEDHIE